jgi:DNA-binding NtrC family response regulator
MARLALLVESGHFSLTEICAAALNPLTPLRTNWQRVLADGPHAVDLVIAVLPPGAPALREKLQQLSAKWPAAPLIAVLQAEEAALGAAALVVDDFVVDPFGPEELRQRVARLIGPMRPGVDAAQERLTQEMALAGLVGRDPAFVRTLEMLPILARSSGAVLITGETGTGKELYARAIHHLGARRHQPFIAVDCAALPETLFESEMFGHARGAFTDAHRDRKGLVALAGEGDLFLDEIDSLSLASQAKLLRLLQDRTYRPVGAERFLPAPAKFLAASNQRLERLVEEKKFRADLFFRLNVLRVELTPLRERRGDIPLLVRHFLEELEPECGGLRKTVAPALLDRLIAHDWPGNVRELYNLLQRAVALAPDEQRQLTHVTGLPVAAAKPAQTEASFRAARAQTLAEFERGYVEEALRRTDGNVTQAARIAGKDRRVFGRLIKRHRVHHAPE